MKRFEFKLQPLLKYRQYQERIAQQNVAKAVMDVKNCEKQIFYLEQRHNESTNVIEAIVRRGVNAGEFRQYHQYLDSVETSIKEEKSKKTQLERTLEEKLLELKKKSVDKKAMEVYREKLKVQYTQDAIKIEQKELDEISSIKTARKISYETL